MSRLPSSTAFHRITFILLLPAALALTVGCSKKPELTKISGPAQGTTYNLTFELPADNQTPVSEIQKKVDAEFARIDKALSNYRDDSAIEEFNAQMTTEIVSADAELVALIEEARKVYHASNGCYDLTIKPLFDLWGFKKDEFSPPSDEALAQTLANVGLDKLETIDATHLRKKVPDLRVDISSIGQGYSVGRVAKLLEELGIENYLAEVGGELQVKGKKPDGEAWRIAIEKPLPNERKLHKIASFDSGERVSLIASGTYRHFFDSNGKRYSHILDARSGKPVEHNTVSVTLFHEDPTKADAWSTALLCLGSKDGLKVANEYGLPVLFIDQTGDELTEYESEALKTFRGVSLKLP